VIGTRHGFADPALGFSGIIRAPHRFKRWLGAENLKLICRIFEVARADSLSTAELRLPMIKGGSGALRRTALPAPRSGLRPRAHGRASSKLDPD
jgi:hypothetical protein